MILKMDQEGTQTNGRNQKKIDDHTIIINYVKQNMIIGNRTAIVSLAEKDETINRISWLKTLNRLKTSKTADTFFGKGAPMVSEQNTEIWPCYQENETVNILWYSEKRMGHLAESGELYNLLINSKNRLCNRVDSVDHRIRL